MKARITSIKDLQATCDDLYNYFAERLVEVTEVEKEEKKDRTTIYLHVVKTKYNENCLQLVRYNEGDLWFWADGYNGLMCGKWFNRDNHDLNAMVITTGENLGWKQYTNKNGQKSADLKKRAILLDLKLKLEILFRDYL